MTLYYRILPGLQDAQRRFKEHEGDPECRLDGCKGIEEYVKKLGLKPTRVRKWRQRENERQALHEIKLLAGGTGTCPECGNAKGHAPSCPHYTPPPPLPPENETEKAILAEQCLRMTRMLLGPSVEPLPERVKKVIRMAESVQEAAASGRYDGADFVKGRPSSEPKREPIPEPEPGSLEELRHEAHMSLSSECGEEPTFKAWEDYQLPQAEGYSLKYFEAAHKYFAYDFGRLWSHVDMKKILAMLQTEPVKARERADDCVKLANLMRSAAENLSLLAAAITTALSPPPTPEPESASELVTEQGEPETRKEIAAPATPLNVEAKPPAVSKLEQAEGWLRPYLNDGPMPIPASYRQHGLCRYNYPPDALPPLGIGKKTIDQAIINLGVERLCSGPKGGMRWHLPEAGNKHPGPESPKPITAIATAFQDTPTPFYKKRVLRMNGEELVDYPVFKRGAGNVPEDVFDAESDAIAYIARATAKAGVD